jgi:hypothetical protein
MGTRQMVPDPSTIQSTIRAVRCPKLPAPRFLVAAVAGFDLSAGWWSLPKPQSNGAWDRGQYLGRFRTGGISPTRLQVPNPLRTPGRSLNSTTVKTFDRAHIQQRQQKYLRPGRPGASALPRNSRRAATRNLGTIVPFGRCAVHAAGINWSTGEFGWVRNSRVLVATLPRSPIPTKANKTALYAPGVVRFSQPAASSGGLLNAENSGPKFEPPGAKPQPSSKCRFSSP